MTKITSKGTNDESSSSDDGRGDTYLCLFCNEAYSFYRWMDSVHILSQMAHDQCAGVDSDDYTCDICK